MLHKLTMSDRAELHGEDNMGHEQPDEETNGKPGLWLIKDSGIYLMSNGNPGLPDTETNHNRDSLLKVAYAKGYGPLADYDTIRQAVGGDDFTEGTLNVEWFEAALLRVPGIEIADSSDCNRPSERSDGRFWLFQFSFGCC